MPWTLARYISDSLWIECNLDLSVISYLDKSRSQTPNQVVNMEKTVLLFWFNTNEQNFNCCSFDNMKYAFSERVVLRWLEEINQSNEDLLI